MMINMIIMLHGSCDDICGQDNDGYVAIALSRSLAVTGYSREPLHALVTTSYLSTGVLKSDSNVPSTAETQTTSIKHNTNNPTELKKKLKIPSFSRRVASSINELNLRDNHTVSIDLAQSLVLCMNKCMTSNLNARCSEWQPCICYLCNK